MGVTGSVPEADAHAAYLNALPGYFGRHQLRRMARADLQRWSAAVNQVSHRQMTFPV